MRFKSIAILASIALMLPATASFAQLPLDKPPAPETQWQFTIPLQDGNLQLGDFVGELAGHIGMDGDAIRKQCDYLVPIRTPVGVSTLQFVRTLTTGVLKIELASDQMTVKVDLIHLRRQRTEINAAIQQLIENFFPEAAALAKAQFGTVIHLPDGSTQKIAPDNAPAQAVVLIHGLDDVGHLWRSLTPSLLQAGYGVCEITYPDDQAINDSSRYVASLFEEMHKDGVQHISIVAHSMGSLISRDLITNPNYYAGSVEGDDRFPRIDRFIMLGPPNHGSKMAVLRFSAGLRDALVETLSGDGLLIGAFFDGAGEAQDDLMPDSAFLKELNARALPAGLPVTIIAGSASPIQIDALETLAKEYDVPNAKYGAVLDGTALKNGLEDLIAGLGDGCVSLDSTRLDGVTDYVIVNANHMSMIKNDSKKSDHVPPAIPIILDRLARDRTPKP